MLQIQNNIQLLQKTVSGRLEQLSNEELTLSKEVTVYEDKISDWEKQSSDIKDLGLYVPKRISTSASNLCQVNSPCTFSFFILIKSLLSRKPKIFYIL